MNSKLLARLLKIRQGDATWQCTVRRAPIWITPKKQPAYRPFILLVVDQDSEMIIKTVVESERPDPQAVLDHLFDAMQSAIFPLLSKRRPARIFIDDEELVRACTSQLAEVNVRAVLRASLPEINAVLHEMEVTMNQREPFPGLLNIQGATVPLVAELYAAAAEFSRQAPWHYFENFEPIEVRYPADKTARYALVLGSGGEFYGLSLYESLTDLNVVFSREPEQPTSRPITCVSLILEQAPTMSFEDLDAIERYGWEVANDRTYPLVIKTTSGRAENELPTASELALLAAALRTIPTFLKQHLHADRGRPQPAHANLSLPNVHSNQQIMLRYPVIDEKTGDVPAAKIQDPTLEAFIQDWYWDEKSHEFAWQMGQFLFDFLDKLDENGLSEQTVFKHERNCWAIGWLVSHYGDHTVFSPDIFQNGPNFTVEYKRKFSESKFSISSYAATWRKLEKYISSQGHKSDSPTR